ncbi:MAG: polyprenol monophosphomannose synthase [Bacteroidales bacterium]|nr:polyprenol monophosphomannose synthase [Bacteroidales bacterium]MCF0178250.1 polyprenol monophosphomannose synthase [Bacteroidales bacterium]
MTKNLVIIPTYNEKENIAAITAAVFALPEDFDVLVIDDGSPDGTASIVKDLMADNPALHILERKGKLGLGTAYITGFKWALDHDYDYIFEMDADFSHPPKDLVNLLHECRDGDADVAVGSRYCKGISVINWPISRVLISYFASVYVRKMLGVKIFDTTAGFVCYKASVLRAIDLDNIRMKGYGFQIEMKYTAYRLGFKVAEVPIIFVDRTEGTSKMSSGIFGEAFWGVIGLRFRKIKPKK